MIRITKEEDKMRKFLALLLVFVMTLALMMPTAWATPLPTIMANAQDTTSNTIAKYGNVTTDITTADLKAAGFDYGDMVTVEFLDQKLTIPVVPTYSYVDNGSAAVIAPDGGKVSLAINMGNFATTYKLATKNTAGDGTITWTPAAGVTFPVNFVITMSQEDGYREQYLMRDIHRTNVRTDYPALSDAEFANFRMVATTGMAANRLYRTSSPINPELGRNTYADAALKAAGVTVIMNLADNEAAAKAYEGYANTYYAGQKVVYLNLGVDFQAADFQAGLATGLRFFANNPGTYAVHCNEGKDRAGFVSALLECLTGATYDEVVADYMTSYVNYYGVVKGSEQYNAIAKSNIISTLQTAFGVADLSKANLPNEAMEYMLGIGLSTTEIISLVMNLSNSATLLDGLTVVLHTNDVHGAIDGYEKIAAMKANLEATGADVILVDAGDYIQGTTAVSDTKGTNAIALMNAAGYDLAAIGNHEFDYGYENLMTIMKDAKFSVLCANVTDASGKTIFPASTIITSGGVKIGFFGLETPEAQTKANPALIKGLNFLSDKALYECAQKQVDALKAQGANIIVCLSHLGVDSSSQPNRSYDLYKNTTGIDFIIDGHSHTVMTKGTASEPIQSTGTNFKNVGMVLIDQESGKIVGNGLVGTTSVNGSDPVVAALAAKIHATINAEYGQVFAKSEVTLDGTKDGNRTRESNLGDLITDSMLWQAKQLGSSLKVDDAHLLALTNGGGIRATINQGDITKDNVHTVLPFGNTITVVYVTGAQLLEALEASTFCTPASIGGFPQASGIQFTVDTSKAYAPNTATYPNSTYYGPASINRVTINSINGQAFDPAATYGVVTNNFCAAGGDTYYAFTGASGQLDTGVLMDETLMNYITKELNCVVGQTYAKAQNRVVVYSGTNTYNVIPDNKTMTTYSVSENAPASLHIDGDMAKFICVYMDGILVNAANYTVSEGSTIITFAPEYLKTLSVGDHTATAVFTDGTATAVLTINGASPAATSPATGDSGNVAVYTILGLTALLGTGIVVGKKKELF